MDSKNEKYWKDYTIFIEIVESTTQFSPADLMRNYQELISELANGNEYCQDEWDYEFDEDMYIRKQIQKVIENPNLLNNSLFKEFRDKIETLDFEFKKHIENENESNWWEKPKFRI